MGTVHLFSSTSQLAVVSDCTVTVTVRVAWYEKNGCRNIWLTSARAELPEKDQI